MKMVREEERQGWPQVCAVEAERTTCWDSGARMWRRLQGEETGLAMGLEKVRPRIMPRDSGWNWRPSWGRKHGCAVAVLWFFSSSFDTGDETDLLHGKYLKAPKMLEPSMRWQTKQTNKQKNIFYLVLCHNIWQWVYNLGGRSFTSLLAMFKIPIKPEQSVSIIITGGSLYIHVSDNQILTTWHIFHLQAKGRKSCALCILV